MLEKRTPDFIWPKKSASVMGCWERQLLPSPCRDSSKPALLALSAREDKEVRKSWDANKELLLYYESVFSSSTTFWKVSWACPHQQFYDLSLLHSCCFLQQEGFDPMNPVTALWSIRTLASSESVDLTSLLISTVPCTTFLTTVAQHSSPSLPEVL